MKSGQGADKNRRPGKTQGWSRALLLAGVFCLQGSLAYASPTTRPALEQLSAESQSLYQQVRHEVVRVETPVPFWMIRLAERENPLFKWGQVLDAQVRRQLMSPPGGSTAGAGLEAEVAPSVANIGASTAPAMRVVFGETGREGQGTAAPAQQMPQIPRITAKVNTIGLILDSQGHVLIPMYLEKSAATRGPILLYSSDGMCSAHFVGSDPRSNLTVVQMDKMVGRPAELAVHRPEIGSLVMVLTPNQSSARLVVWTGANEDFGVIAGMDGQIGGIVRTGDLLSPRALKTISQKLIDVGSIKRAVLGVLIDEVGPDDPVRQKMASLGNRPAIVVKQVLPDSPADKSGIRPGDLILQLAGENIEDKLSFAAAIADRSGATDLEILRDGHLIETHVMLQPH